MARNLPQVSQSVPVHDMPSFALSCYLEKKKTTIQRCIKYKNPPANVAKLRNLVELHCPIPSAAGLDLDRAHHCIYVIFHQHQHFQVYVGQTSKTVWERFKKHASTANRGSTESTLYNYIRKHGLHGLLVMPLEIVQPQPNILQPWRSIALPREQYWCDILKTNGYWLYNKNQPHAASALQHPTHSRLRPIAPMPAAEHVEDPVAPPSPPAPPPPRFFISRINAAKIQDLARKLTAGQFSPANLSFFKPPRYKTRTLYNLRSFLGQNSSQEIGISYDMHAALLDIIKRAILHRIPKPASRKDPTGRFLIKTPFHPIFDKINFRTVFAGAKEHIPINAPSNPMVCFRFTKKLSSLFCNQVSLSRMPLQQLEDIANGPCSCADAACGKFIPNGLEHVFTNDASILPLPKLQKLAERGANFRFGQEKGVITQEMHAQAGDDFREAAIAFAAMNQEQRGLDGWDRWLTEVETVFRQHLSLKAPIGSMYGMNSLQASQNTLLLSTRDERSLHAFQGRYVITLVDKMANTFCFICRKYYARMMLDDLRASAVFTQVDMPVASVLEGIQQQCAELRLPHKSSDFGSYYALGKLHKTPPALRFIVGAANTVTTEASKLLTVVLGILQEDFPKLISHAHPHCASATGEVQIHWHGLDIILKNTQDVVTAIQLFNASHANVEVALNTGDVSRLYTFIQLLDLKGQLTTLYTKVFALHPGQVLKVYLNPRNGNKNTFKWIRPGEGPLEGETGRDRHGEWRNFSLLSLLKLLDFIIDQNYFLFGQKLFKQIQGIAMGGNASVHIANHYLFSYELQFLASLKQHLVWFPPVAPVPLTLADFLDYPSRAYYIGDVALFLADQTNWIFRYIDDIFVFNCPILEHILYRGQSFHGISGIYPDCLKITLSDNGPEANFLDVSVVPMRGDGKTPVITKHYSKFDEDDYKDLGLEKTRFTHYTSNIALRLKNNILTGRFSALKEHIMDPSSFCRAMAKVLRTLIRRGYPKAACLTRFRRLCSRHSGIYGRSGYTIRMETIRKLENLS